MKKVLLFGLLICFQSAFSQVSIEKNRLVKDGVPYKFSKHEEVFKNPEAKNYFKQGRTNRTIANVLAFTGGFGMGFSFVQIISAPKESRLANPYGGYVTFKTNNSARWTVFGVVAGLAVISIPLYISFSKNSKKAIEIENGESTVFQPYFKMETAGNGMALSYNF